MIIINTTLILGAGFSSIAGLPLTNQLFEGEVFTASKRSEIDFEEVIRCWNDWKSKNPLLSAEQFLTEIYFSPMTMLISWTSVVEYLTARLATPLKYDRGAFNPRYAGRITKPLNIETYEKFWDAILSQFNLQSIITLNYDLLVERGLRHRQMIRKNRPGIFYGGILLPQVLKGSALPFNSISSGKYEELTGRIPLYKLHGSLNWGKENGKLVLYQDQRPAFRRKGIAQIIPPIEKKETPIWLSKIWESAEEALSKSEIWFICGYSLPEYDLGIRELFISAASRGNLKRIILSNPEAQLLANLWKSISPNSEINLLPGLPDAILYIPEIGV